MLVIAVTGGIGSGKSTVAVLFKEKGIPVIDTDQISRELVQPGTPILQQIIREFGKEYLDANGQLKRKDLGHLIFANTSARDKLEALLHPTIHSEVLKRLKKLDSPYCLILIPLLVRSKQLYPYDRILVVDTPPDLQIQRTTTRDKQDPDFVRQIIAIQPSRDDLLKLADDVLDNSGDLINLKAAVDRIHQHYLELAKQRS